MAKGIKLLKDLRVIDLKFELDTRKLATNGSKAVLAECLAKKLQEEGYDAEKFEFNYEKSKVFLIIALLIRVVHKLRWDDFGFFWPPTPGPCVDIFYGVD